MNVVIGSLIQWMETYIVLERNLLIVTIYQLKF